MKNKSLHILLVEDDKYFRMGIKDILMKYGVTLEAENADEAKKILGSQKIDLAIIDIHLGTDPLGLEVLKVAKKLNIPSIILSSCDDDEITEKAYDAGCEHFLVKRFYREHLEDYIKNIIKSMTGSLLDSFFKNSFITQDEDTIDQIKALSEINLKDKSVFISGETGVGKSLVGKLLHKLNFDASAPFVHINCSEIAENLLEAELFGAKKGAFTGADRDRIGKIKQADGGILFLDEIATMPMAMQQKLLKALDEKTFYPVGSPKVEKSSFTLISATCEDLFEKVSNNSFRKDLFFRISGINLDLKPLRSRPKDIELLAKSFLKKSPRRIVVKPEAMDAIKAYSWPGNTRELLKLCELISLKSKGVIKLQDLPKHIVSEKKNSDLEQEKFLTSTQVDYIEENGLKDFIKILERDVVSSCLKKNNGKIAKTIKDLRISSSAFYRVLESLS